ncbi:hypothetical protein D3C81_2321470 [compost metagenome]
MGHDHRRAVGAIVDLSSSRVAIFAVIEVAQFSLELVAGTQVSRVFDARVMLAVNVVHHAVEIRGLKVGA